MGFSYFIKHVKNSHNRMRYEKFAKHLILFSFPLLVIYINKEKIFSEWKDSTYMMPDEEMSVT